METKMTMSSGLMGRLDHMLETRRQTKALSQAIMDNNVVAMKQALESGANPQGATGVFEEMEIDFQAAGPTKRKVVGALAMAVEKGLPRETIDMLIEHGAIPTRGFEAVLRRNPGPAQRSVKAALEAQKSSDNVAPSNRAMKP